MSEHEHEEIKTLRKEVTDLKNELAEMKAKCNLDQPTETTQPREVPENESTPEPASEPAESEENSSNSDTTE